MLIYSNKNWVLLHHNFCMINVWWSTSSTMTFVQTNGYKVLNIVWFSFVIKQTTWVSRSHNWKTRYTQWEFTQQILRREESKQLWYNHFYNRTINHCCNIIANNLFLIFVSFINCLIKETFILCYSWKYIIIIIVI